MNKPSQWFATIIASALLCAGATTPVIAQDAAPPPDVTVVHPEDDGFPDLSAAYATLSNSAFGKNILSGIHSGKYGFKEGTLTEKRAIVNDPAVQSALALLHSALAAPKINIAPQTVIHIFWSVFIRLLVTQQYVQLADGKTLAAIDTLADGFRLADALSTSAGLGRAYAESLKTTLIQATAAHLDQLSAGDSAYLLSISRRELAQPDRFLQACESERQDRLSSVDKMVEVIIKAAGAEDSSTAGIDKAFNLTPAIRQRAADALSTNPAARTAFVQSIRQRIDAYFDDLEARYQAFPTVAPDTLAVQNGKTVTGYAAADQVAGFLVALNTKAPGYEQSVIENEMRVRASQRLLAVHAAIVGYRWEHNRVPDSLAELKLGDLAQDPFSAQPFQYAKTGDRTYTLGSIGSPKRVVDGNGDRTADGKPVPISLLP